MTIRIVSAEDKGDPRPGRGLEPSRLRSRDAVRLGTAGLRSRPLRVVLSALGIAIGIAAMVSVVGISSSSRAELDRLLARIGTNLLTAAPGQTLSGGDATLPKDSTPMVRRIGAVTAVSATGKLSNASVYRNDHIPANESNGIAVLATQNSLASAVGGNVVSGTWFNDGTAKGHGVVLGDKAARYLGIGAAGPGIQVLVGGHWFTVIGILDRVPLAPELDTAALVGWEAARSFLDFDGNPTTLYCRSTDTAVSAVRSVLAATVNPEHPEEVKISRPSDALAAKSAANTTFTALLLGLGAVALLVGGVGVANIMVISVLERRSEIGLRRALGATRGHIRLQFLTESLLLSVLGGVVGVLLGYGVTAGYSLSQGWPAVVPAPATAGGLAATVGIGVLAGLYPALRAARLAPTEALATP